MRSLAVPGALLSTTILAVAPSVASSDTTPVLTVRSEVTAKASSTLSVNQVRRDIIEGRDVVVAGALRPAGSGRAVALQVAASRGGWTTVDHDRTNHEGRYRLRWRATSTGTRRMRVDFGGTRELSSAHRPVGAARIYRRAVASWYGPGLYGGHLACGGTLSANTLGVAHKSLPCGTEVTLHYRGRTVRVPVVDRGPFVGGREFDLTAATRARLGFGSTGIVMSTV